MKQRDIVVLLLAMVVIATGAVLVNHYAFANSSPPPIALTTTTTNPLAQAYRACVADGATVETAMAAFVAENPDVNLTESSLVDNVLGGPYLQSWPSNPEFYNFALKHGVLYLRAGTSGLLSALPSITFEYTGQISCVNLGL